MLGDIYMDMGLKGKNAIICASSRGLGKGCAKALASEGVDLVINGRDQEVLSSTANEIRNEFNIKVIEFCADITSKDSQSKLLEICPAPDILVNNAGLMRRGDITNTSDDDYEMSMAINVEAPFRIVRSIIPLMSNAGGGSIVNVSSCWGINPGPNHLIYCTTKAALATMTKCLGRDHAHQNIRINAVCPNEVNTPMLRTGFEIRGLDSNDAINELNQSVPIGHIAEPEEIADVITFLTSNEARYICGSLVEINGGKAVY